jgi:cysteine desulfurase
MSGYLDHASGSPLHPAAREVLLAAYDEGWADPSRLYASARRARLLLDEARARVAAALGVRPDEVSFTSSGTASVHAALQGALLGRSRVGRHLVTSAVEHSSVLAVAEGLEAAGGTATRVGVDRNGVVDVTALANALRDDTAVVSLQAANHEVGTLQPLAEVVEICGRRGVPMHTDAAQTVGRLPGGLPDGIALASASAHKWGGPPGVGVLVLRKGTRWRSPAPSDEREARRWPGFENVPGALATAAALDARGTEVEAENALHRAWVDRVREQVPRLIGDVEVVGHPTERLPHLVTFSCLYVEGEALVTELDRLGLAVSSGSSCTSSTLEPSHVLVAMGVLTHGNVRVSFGRDTTEADVDRLLEVLPGAVASVREGAR